MSFKGARGIRGHARTRTRTKWRARTNCRGEVVGETNDRLTASGNTDNGGDYRLAVELGMAGPALLALNTIDALPLVRGTVMNVLPVLLFY